MPRKTQENRNPRLDPEQASRQRYFATFIEPENKGLEIGPLTRPTFPKWQGFNVQSLDRRATEELKATYTDVPNIDTTLIEDVDWVWQGGSYDDIPGIPHDFDFITSCHSIEHSTDIVEFFESCSSLLQENGLLFLAVPSKNLMFDYYRPLTTLGDILMGHYYPQAYDMKARVDELYLASSLEGKICWSPDEAIRATLRGQRPLPIRPSKDLPVFLGDIEKWQHEKDYRDAHRWVFERETLAHLVSELSNLGLCDFIVKDHSSGVGCEFLMVLQKVGKNQEKPAPMEEAALLRYRAPERRQIRFSHLARPAGIKAVALSPLRFGKRVVRFALRQLRKIIRPSSR
jgi:SAM-dependent methyltransferase